MTTAHQDLPGVVPPLTLLQEAAQMYVNTMQDAETLKTRAKKRLEEMVAQAGKDGVDFVKVRDDMGFLHTFAFETKSTVRHTKMLDVKIVKHDEKPTHDGKMAAAGDVG